MGKAFSDKVEQALQYIYYNEREQKGEEGRNLLVEAIQEGDADAMCILARSCCGKKYVWEGHNFPVQDEESIQLLRHSVERGSAIGVLVALRSGELTPSLVQKMPFASIQEAFQKVEEMAAQGDPFCQYTVGNTYFWWDFLRIQEKGRESFGSEEEFRAYLKENIQKCEDWFWRAFHGGVFFAGNNLNRFYQDGDEDLIPPQPEKAKDIARIGAEYGYPIWQYSYAWDLWHNEEYSEAVTWYQRAAEGGQMDAYYWLGCAYDEGRALPEDPQKAAECFDRCLSCEWCSNHIGSANMLGSYYFEGRGVPQDYAKAYQLLSWAFLASREEVNFGAYYLAKCCFEGLGTQQDYELAWKYLQRVDWKNSNADYMRGYLFCNGLGGLPEDIKTGVELLQKSGTNQAKEELLKYKKGLFGKWKRR